MAADQQPNAARDRGARGKPRRLPVGAEVVSGGVHFRVWAPAVTRVEVVLEAGRAGSFALERERDGYHAGFSAAAGAGTRYGYRLDGSDPLPDPASRFQPEGPHGASEVIDPASFAWTDARWPGVSAEGQVIYELHVGTLTPEGTWAAAVRELPALADLGVTLLEVMPVVEFDGDFGWGYDGVDLFAPSHLYGGPDDFRRFVDRAHALGLGVILDVVYNHVGPSGNYLPRFAPGYFTDRYSNEWGDALDFDGPDAAPVRELFVANAGYWIDEFHCDGLRLDATQQIFDSSDEHVVAAITRRVREAARGRGTFVVAENEPQDVRALRPRSAGGWGVDAMWNDDFHHSAVVAVTGRREAYYTDHLGHPQELISALKWGFLYQGQYYSWQKRSRGTSSLDLAPSRLVLFLENHDQVANSARGLRLHAMTSAGRWRAMTALLLLAPGTPMLFQGQEFAASSPWLFFAHHEPELARQVRAGRREFLAQFASAATPEIAAALADPGDPATFARCKLVPEERARHLEAVALHHDLLELRRTDPVFRLPRARGLDGAVIAGAAAALRFFAPDGGDRLVLVNLGALLRLESAPEPLLAPPAGCRWRLAWSSEDPRYGGGGTLPLVDDRPWQVQAESAVVLVPVPREPD